jgi:uncharacterized protein (TIGR03435 family)
MSAMRGLAAGSLLCCTACAVLVVAGGLCAQAPTEGSTETAAAMKFDVVSIKQSKIAGGRMAIYTAWRSPDEFVAIDTTAQGLLKDAYGIEQDGEILGAPPWANSERFDVDAKAGPIEAAALNNAGDKRAMLGRQMLQSLLAERLGLVIHRETKELPIYVLVVTKGGPKFAAAKLNGPQTFRMLVGQFILQGQSIGTLVQALSERPELDGRVIEDRTGLTGNYDLTLQWTPVTTTPLRPDAPQLPDTSGTTIFAALQEQLGLKLESTKGPVDTIVIDRIQKPSEN